MTDAADANIVVPAEMPKHVMSSAQMRGGSSRAAAAAGAPEKASNEEHAVAGMLPRTHERQVCYVVDQHAEQGGHQVCRRTQLLALPAAQLTETRSERVRAQTNGAQVPPIYITHQHIHSVGVTSSARHRQRLCESFTASESARQAEEAAASYAAATHSLEGVGAVDLENAHAATDIHNN